jgi:hypothetical protein
MAKSTTLNQLLLLSKRHLKLAKEEKWDEWEAVVRAKRKVYEEIIAEEGGAIENEYEEYIFEIARIERETREILQKKEEETKEELSSVIRLRSALKGYRGTKKRAESHFSLHC